MVRIMSLVDLLLTPSRPFRPRHARWLVAGVGLVFLIGGARLVALGAWPVIPFMLLDLALLGWAFAASYRSGRAYETVRLEPGSLTVRQVSPRGRTRHIEFEPQFARAELERVGDDDNRLWLDSRGRRIAVGGFLSPPERVAIHRLLADALRRLR